MWHGLDCGVRLENLWSIGFEAFEIASLRDREGLYDDLLDANLLSAVVVAQKPLSAKEQKKKAEEEKKREEYRRK